jgi:hypothetical protein
MKTYAFSHPRRDVALLARLDYWFDRLDRGDEPDLGDWGWAWMNESVADPSNWGAIIGRGRELLRRHKIERPEASEFIRMMEERIEIYAQHIGWRAQRAMEHEFGYGGIELVATGLDTKVTHGPADRSIGWGLGEIPRFDF